MTRAEGKSLGVRTLWRAIRDVLKRAPSVGRWRRISLVDESAAASTSLRELLGRCPACLALLDGHHFFSLGQIAAKGIGDPSAREFRELVAAHDWTRVRTFRQWDAQADALACEIVRCPSGRSVMLLSFWPFEIYAANQIVSSELLEPVIAQNLPIASTEWRPF